MCAFLSVDEYIAPRRIASDVISKFELFDEAIQKI